MIASEKGQAHLSECGTYRYSLSRHWNVRKPWVLFIGLNPSTADASQLDPTMRRVATFADREGYGGMWIGNLFAFRATEPGDMKAAAAPVGPENDTWLADMARWVGPGNVIVGWGTHGGHHDRHIEVMKLLDGYRPRAFTVTKNGQPGHPLYLSSTQPLTEYGLGRDA